MLCFSPVDLVLQKTCQPDSVAAADALIGGNTIPMKVAPNSPLGQRMTALAAFLETYNKGTTTAGCNGSGGVGSISSRLAMEQLPADGFVLDQNYPNPFSETTSIGYRLGETRQVSVMIYNFIGEHVTTLADGIQQAGYHAVEFDGSELPVGIYFCRLQSGDFTATTKLFLVK
jgi:hypothetical protein